MAATPSLRRLSLSISSASRPFTPVSRNSAITAIGSVAAISEPNASAGPVGQFSHRPDPPRRRGAKHDPEARYQQDRREIALQFAPVQVQRGFKQQGRQNDVEDEVVSELHPDVDMPERQRQARHHEADGVGQTKPPRDDRHNHRVSQQCQDTPEQEFHRITVDGAASQRNRLALNFDRLATEKSASSAKGGDGSLRYQALFRAQWTGLHANPIGGAFKSDRESCVRGRLSPALRNRSGSTGSPSTRTS